MVTTSKDKSHCVLPRRKAGLKMSVKHKVEDHFRLHFVIVTVCF